MKRKGPEFNKTRKHRVWRGYESFRFTDKEVPNGFRQLFKDEILPHLSIAGKKQAEKQRLAMQITHQLVVAGLKVAVVADSRDNNKKGVSLRRKVWDAVVAAGFALEPCVGSEASGKTTRYRAGRKLLALRDDWPLVLTDDRKVKRNISAKRPSQLDPVILRQSDYDPITMFASKEDEVGNLVSLPKYVEARAQRDEHGDPYPAAIENGMEGLAFRGDQIDEINRMGQRHRVNVPRPDSFGIVRSRQVHTDYRQIHCGELFRAARLYTFGEMGAQSLSKEERQRMTFDDEPVAEFDFSGMAISMLYRQCHAKLPKGDVYQPQRVFKRFYATLSHDTKSKQRRARLRAFVKKAINICWNVKSREAAHSSISLAIKESGHSKLLWRAIKTLQDPSIAGFVLRLQKVHHKIADEFFTDVGAELMTRDGLVMLYILLEFARAGKMAIGIHDAVVCKVSDAKFARRVMAECARKYAGTKLRIKRVF